MKNPVMEIKDITRTFQVRNPNSFWGGKRTLHAVDGVSLKLERGRTVGLVGESGCGKTTVGNIIAGHLIPDSGTVLLNGSPLETKREKKTYREIQMIFQDPLGALDPRWPVGKQIREPLDIFSEGTDKDRRKRVQELLALVGLSEEQGNSYPHQLSGGQRQRVVAARALILNPSVLVCDEPVSALDVSIQAQVLNLLMELQQNTQCSYLFVSHDLRVVRHIAHQVLVMYMGRIIEAAPTQVLFENPVHPYTQALLSAVPQPEVNDRRKRIVLTGDPPSPLDLPSGCRFHSRCPHAAERCRKEEPSMFEVENGHKTACHLAENL